MRGRLDGGPVWLFRFGRGERSIATEEYDPRDGSWSNTTVPFMWEPETRVVEPDEAERAMAYMRDQLAVTEAAKDDAPADATDTGSGDVTGSQIIATGGMLDIPFESPDPAPPLQYGGDTPAEPKESDAQTFESQLAWANNFNFGTPMPDDKEEGDGSGGVSSVPKGASSGEGPAPVQGSPPAAPGPARRQPPAS